MTNIKPLSESQEDYLEAIFELITQKGAARVKDIALSMNVASASVNKAVSALTLSGYIEHQRYELIKLTPKGERKAKEVSEKHTALINFFRDVLCISEPEATVAACKTEHAISEKIKNRITFLSRFLLNRKGCSNQWKTMFNDFCTATHNAKDITECVCSGENAQDECAKIR